MTDINGIRADVGDVIAIAFEWNSRGILRVGEIEELLEDDYGRPTAKVLWSKASEGGLPQSPSTVVLLRNFVILN